MLRPSDDDSLGPWDKVSICSYFVFTFLLLLFHFHFGDVDGNRLEWWLVSALLWFGIIFLVKGSYRYWRGSQEARVIALGGR